MSKGGRHPATCFQVEVARGVGASRPRVVPTKYAPVQRASACSVSVRMTPGIVGNVAPPNTICVHRLLACRVLWGERIRLLGVVRARR